MYAVIEVGGKQYVVQKDDIVDVEKQEGDAGIEITVRKVLLVSKDKKVDIGRPYLKDAKVKAEILKHLRGEKVISYKYRRRKASHWKKGHRQSLTRLRITSVE